MTVHYHDDRPIVHFGNVDTTGYWKPESTIEVTR